MVAWHIHATLQPATSALGTSVRGTLQGAINRWAFAGLPARRVRLCALESGAGADCLAAWEVGEFPLEQLSGIPATEIASTVAASGSAIWRAWIGKGHAAEPARI